jgi:hypothetical protein
MKTDYILRAPEPGIRGRTIMKVSSDGRRESGTAVLFLPAGTGSETMADALQALRKAHEEGREERSAELIPARDEPADFLRTLVREETIGSIAQWATGWTEPVDGNTPRQHYITLEDIDGASHVISVAVGEGRYGPPLKRFRVQVLIEEIEQR